MIVCSVYDYNKWGLGLGGDYGSLLHKYYVTYTSEKKTPCTIKSVYPEVGMPLRSFSLKGEDGLIWVGPAHYGQSGRVLDTEPTFSLLASSFGGLGWVYGVF